MNVHHPQNYGTIRFWSIPSLQRILTSSVQNPCWWLVIVTGSKQQMEWQRPLNAAYLNVDYLISVGMAWNRFFSCWILSTTSSKFKMCIEDSHIDGDMLFVDIGFGQYLLEHWISGMKNQPPQLFWCSPNSWAGFIVSGKQISQSLVHNPSNLSVPPAKRNWFVQSSFGNYHFISLS